VDIRLLVSPHLQETPQPKDMTPHPKGYIDFSFGNPSPETFPIEEIIFAARNRVTKDSLQYCADRGSENLLVSLSKWLGSWQEFSVKTENLITTNGSMDGIALIADTFIDSGDVVIAESPTYWKAREIFQNAGAQVIYIPVAEDGLKIDLLEDRILETLQMGKKCKLLYTIPNHQNPTGYITSLEKRKRIVSVCEKHNILIIEDDVYSHLTYDGNILPSIYSLSNGMSVVQVGSLSKLISPGIRIGWIVGSKVTCDFILKIKRDGGTNPLASEISAFLLDNIDWKERINYLRDFYNIRLETMFINLQKIPPNLLSWEKPKGGFYFWAKVSHNIPLSQLEKLCLKRDVGFMPGYLCTNDDNIGHDHIRLSFSDLSSVQIESGIERLRDALIQMQE